MGRQNIGSRSPWESIVGYSRAVRVDQMIAVAGTTSVDDRGAVVGAGDAAEQTTRALQIIEAALTALGASMRDVVRTRIFVTNIADWEAIGKAHGEFFRDIRPVATMVEVSRLIDPALLVEIEADAIVGAGDDA
jgi:enamine deaminase RidA (YjgF/YER057c/UK114 family)